jgi:hypothetical protein
MRRLSTLCILALVTAPVFAAPTTKPATPSKPAAKVQPLPERDTTTVTNAAGKFKIRIPKDWKAEPANGATLQYELPQNKSSWDMAGDFMLRAGALCHPNATLEEQADANTKAWQENIENFKLIKDETTELAGVPARMITYDRTYEIVTIDPRTHAEKKSNGQMRSLALMCINGGQGYFIDFNIERKNFETKLNLIKRVIAGFEWLEKPTTKPSASK